MAERKYTIQIVGRGEDVAYADHDLELSLERTYVNGHRLYCRNTSGENGAPAIPFVKRRDIIENLCEHFDTTKEPIIFVLDEADKDRQELERLFADLELRGHRIMVEYDSAAKREQVQDETYLSILKAGKKLSINGREIASVDEYWKWKNDA